MSNYSEEVVSDVLRTYKQTRQSPFKTARHCGISTADVFAIVDQHKDRLESAQERHGGFGRPELKEFLVGRRRASGVQWDNEDPLIAKARVDYEEGTHDMATGRDGQWLLLYSIPLRRRVKDRKDYFKPEQG